MWGWLKKLINRGGEEIGDIEDVIHHPLYPIEFYWAIVDPGKLMRGGWPDESHLHTLKSNGYNQIINLCSERSQNSLVIAQGLKSVEIPICDNTVPTPTQVEQFINLCKLSPSYVHCEAGKGRTGCMVAAYRVLVQNWFPGVALVEAKKYGLGIPEQEDFILSLKR